MGRAEDLFKRLSAHGDQAIDDLIVDRQSEELFLDFKRSADDGSGKRLHNDDRSNLAKAISGFGNSEGGIIVWGIDCSRQASIGDVASARVPIQNPRRFVSWLEGTISGCTVPPHPRVRHLAIESSGLGFVVTYIPRSYLAPHQCLRPPQYYIRAGSDFVPAPHGVLMGLFGRQPQPSVFHMWTSGPAQLVPKSGSTIAADCEVGFMLSSHGPGIARDLYITLKLRPPKGGTKIVFSVPDRANWTGSHLFGMITNLVSGDSFKLAPEAVVTPLVLSLSFAPPFNSSWTYEFTFGHAASPVRRVEATIEREMLQSAYDIFRGSDGGSSAGLEFVRTVMAIEETEEQGQEYYREPD